VQLTVTDSAGLTSTTFVDVTPVIRQITLNTVPAGLGVTLDGQPFTAPLTADSVVGVLRDIGVSSPQSSGGKVYGFTSWSDGGAATHSITTPATNTTYTATLSETSGFTGEYYDNQNLTTLVTTRADANIDFDWGTGAPAAGVGVDTFSVRWTGNVVPQFSQTYTFYTVSDDGVRLWVNGALVIDNWTDHGATENTANVALVAGQSYSIKMEFYENGGGAVAKLHWSSPSTPRQPVPPGGVVSGGNQLTIASSSSAGAFQTAPALAHDNNESTRYANDGNLATASITFNLAQSTSVAKVRLLLYNGATRTYPLRISVGSTVVFTGNTSVGSGYWETAFPPVTGSTITVTMTGPNSSASNWFSIWETKLFGP
jgi:hypothetical protein